MLTKQHQSLIEKNNNNDTRVATGTYTVLQSILKLCEERSSSGFFGMIGLGTKHSTTPR